MPAPVENLTVFAIIPGLLAVMASFIIGMVVSLPILAVASLTRLVGHEPPKKAGYRMGPRGR